MTLTHATLSTEVCVPGLTLPPPLWPQFHYVCQTSGLVGNRESHTTVVFASGAFLVPPQRGPGHLEEGRLLALTLLHRGGCPTIGNGGQAP